MVEATLVLLVFFTLLLGVIDCGQVLFAHQSLVERVRAAVRWGVVHPWNQETGSDDDRQLGSLQPDRSAARKPAWVSGIAAGERGGSSRRRRPSVPTMKHSA